MEYAIVDQVQAGPCEWFRLQAGARQPFDSSKGDFLIARVGVQNRVILAGGSGGFDACIGST